MAKHLSTWCLKRMFVLTNRLNFCQPSRSVRASAGEHALVPKFPQIREINIDYEEPKDFREFLDESKTGIKFAVHALVKLLYIDPSSAMRAIDLYPAFKGLSKKTIYANFYVLRDAGMNKSTIIDHKFLLTDTTEDLKKKIQSIKMLDIDINEAAHLFPLEISALASFADTSKTDVTYLPNGNRIHYLAEKFNADISAICRLLAYNSFMLTLPAPKLLSITEYILEVGMSGEHIMNDLHIYRYQIDTIKRKVEEAKKANVKPLKPWVVRCAKHAWTKVEERNDRIQSALNPHPSLEDLLCEIFECEADSVHFLMSRDLALNFMGMEKFMKNARFIRSQGYTIEDLQRSPRVLHRKHETLIEYFNLSKQYGIEYLSLGNYIQSRPHFMRVLNRKRPKIDAENTK